MDTLDVEDVLGDSINLFGDDQEKDDGTITYGPLVLTTAPKVRSQPRRLCVLDS